MYTWDIYIKIYNLIHSSIIILDKLLSVRSMKIGIIKVFILASLILWCFSFLYVDPFLTYIIFPLSKELLFNTSSKASPVTTHPFNFCSSEKFCISFCKHNFVRYRILGWCFFFLNTFYLTLLSSCLTGFWEVGCNSCLGSSIGKVVFLPSGSFQEFLFIFHFP